MPVRLSYDAPAAHLGLGHRLVACNLKTLASPRTGALAREDLDDTLGSTEAA